MTRLWTQQQSVAVPTDFPLGKIRDFLTVKSSSCHRHLPLSICFFLFVIPFIVPFFIPSLRCLTCTCGYFASRCVVVSVCITTTFFPVRMPFRPRLHDGHPFFTHNAVPTLPHPFRSLRIPRSRCCSTTRSSGRSASSSRRGSRSTRRTAHRR